MKLYTKVEEPADVRVIVPYTKRTDKLQLVIDCLRYQFVQPEPVLMRSDESYWELLNQEFHKGEEFFIVEHDVVVWPGAIALMQQCESPWCTLPSLCRGVLMPTTLGCTKFSQKFVQEHPDHMEELDQLWFHLDANVATKIREEYDTEPCVHFPAATHLNEIHWPDHLSKRYNQYKYWKLQVQEPLRAQAS